MTKAAMVRRLATAAVLILVTTAGAGCSAKIAGTGVPDPAAPEVALDTGGLSTEPRTPQTSPVQQRVLAANALSDKALFPWDIDPTFTQSGLRSTAIVLAADKLIRSDDDRPRAEALKSRGLRYGFLDGRRSTVSRAESGLYVELLRMREDAGAAGAVADARETAGPRAYPLPERPDVAVTRESPAAQPRVTFFATFAVGPVVVGLNSWGRDEAAARDRLIRAIDAQRDLLTGYASPNDSEVASLPADRDGIVGYTLAPEQPAPGTFSQQYGFHTARSQLHWDDDPVASAKLFETTGMELAGWGANTVYRAKDAAGAERIATQWTDSLAARFPTSQRVGVDHLPAAKCVSYNPDGEISSSSRVTCYVTVGRYLSEVSDPQPARARQMTSAAYLILRKAR